jgi:hypothetical protein
MLDHARNRFPLCVLPLFAGLFLCLSAFPPTASAGKYEVFNVCKPVRPQVDVEDEPVFPNEPIPTMGFTFEDRCGRGEGALTLVAQGAAVSGGKRWTITAPPNTTIRGLEYERIFSRPWPTGFIWELRHSTPNGGGSLEFNRSPEIPPDGTRLHNTPLLDAPTISGVLYCELRLSCAVGNGTAPKVEAKNFDLVLGDKFAPVVPRPSGPLVSGSPVRDTQIVSASATDKGSGIAKAFLVVDEVNQEAVLNTNGGKCLEPFFELVPCRLSVTSSLELDTTELSEGFHELQAVFVDASGNRGESPPVVFLVHNAPTNTEPPAISGRPQVGKELKVSAGDWDGDPTAYTFQWLRCPVTAELISDCDRIRGATRDEYAVTKGDLRSQELVVVKATNRFGSETAYSDATSLVRGGSGTRPTLRGVRLTRKTFHLGGGRAAANSASGTVLRFLSSEAGKLRVAITPVRKGGKGLLLSRRVKAGRGKVAINGRVGRRQLRPGLYLLLVSLTDAAGDVSKPVRLSFLVLPG